MAHPHPPAVAPTNAGIVGKTVECHGVKYVVLAIQYDPQYGQWFALVQREDGSLDCASLHAARVI